MAEAGLSREDGSKSTGTLDITSGDPNGGFLDDTAELPSGESAEESQTRKRPKPRKPGQPWDGRFASLTLEEYRAMKWGMDASFNATRRKGPSYTLRPQLPIQYRASTNCLLEVDVAKALDKVKPAPPTWTCGLAPMPTNRERSQGPAQYQFRCTMETRGHPSIGPKNTGTRIGTEKQRPNVRDAKNPAPGEYSQDNYQMRSEYKSFPKYTKQGRESWKPPTAAPGPGVGEYGIEEKYRVGKDTPIRWTMQGRTELKKKPVGSRRFIRPGPNDYQEADKVHQRVEFVHGNSAKWKFGTEPRGYI